MAAKPDLDIPVLTDAVGGRERTVPAGAEHDPRDGDHGIDRETMIAELQTEIAASMFALTDDIMRKAFAEMEASVYEQVSRRLRSEMPELIDALLRARLGEDLDY